MKRFGISFVRGAPHLLALIAGLMLTPVLNVALARQQLTQGTEVIAVVGLMFAPAIAAGLAAVLLPGSMIDTRRVVVPYVWYGLGGSAVLGFLAFASSSLSDAEGIIPRSTQAQQGSANLMFLLLLIVYFGVPIGVPLVRWVMALRTPTDVEPLARGQPDEGAPR